MSIVYAANLQRGKNIKQIQIQSTPKAIIVVEKYYQSGNKLPIIVSHYWPRRRRKQC